MRSVGGGNGHLTIHILPPTEPGGPPAEEVVTQLERCAADRNPGWWGLVKLTRSVVDWVIMSGWRAEARFRRTERLAQSRSTAD